MDALKLANKAPFEGAGLTRRQVAVLMALLASLAMSLLREELRSKRTQTWAQGVTYLTTVLYVVTLSFPSEPFQPAPSFFQNLIRLPIYLGSFISTVSSQSLFLYI